jgi:PAS domain S-box-containing protein
MVGYTEEELKKLSFIDITLEEDRDPNWALVAELLEGKRKQFQIEKRYRRKNGSAVWVRNSVSIVPGTEREPGFLMALSEDVTERRLAEEALNETRSELAHMARVTTLTTLTASIAHEVNQPLSGIVTNASTCLRMLDANPPNLEGARETARRTIRDGNRASEVIARLRALFSKKNARFEMFDLNEAAKEVVALSISELQRNKVILQSELAADLPSVLGDRTQIQQVILNLLRNGWDAMITVDDRPKELLVKTECNDSDGVCLSVKDSGVGIDSEIEKKLFEAFYTTKGDGMGIGLSVSRSIVERHQGRLWAIRNEGPGATFLFSIPRITNTKVQ